MTDLTGVRPELVAALEQHVYPAMAALGKPMIPTQGLRTTAEQETLYAEGRTAPGAIVTNCDGVTQKSNHQAKADGFGYAVDSAFDGPDPYLKHDPRGPLWWATFGACVRAAGLTWGGDFHSIVDQPHAELPGLPPSKGIAA